jgi:uncharacterized protein (DUF433 family)
MVPGQIEFRECGTPVRGATVSTAQEIVYLLTCNNADLAYPVSRARLEKIYPNLHLRAPLVVLPRTETMKDRISVNPHIHFGKPCVAGTRISVQNVLELVREGIGFADMIRDYYPDLQAEDIRACVQYAIDVVAVEDIHLATTPSSFSPTAGLEDSTRPTALRSGSDGARSPR